MIERINELVAARFSGVGTTRGSFFRIHVWAVAFLLLASSVAASHGTNLARRRQQFGRVQNVALGLDDQRAFAPSAYDHRYFHIAWIAGSEAEVFPSASKATYLPRIMLPSLPEIAGKQVVIDVYFLPSMRTADEYFALLDAIAEKPDMIVMSLNAVWAMNPVSVHEWSQLDAKAAAALATKPAEWPVAASLVSPSDLGWGIATHLKPFANRSYYSTKIHKIVDELGPLDRTQLAQLRYYASVNADRYQALFTFAPLGFWFAHRYNACNPSNVAKPPSSRCDATGWGRWIDRSNTMDNSLNRTVITAIGRELKASKIPSYVYLSQVNDTWLDRDPVVRAAVAGVERQLRNEAGAFHARNIRFQPTSATRFVTGLGFLANDPVHIAQAGTLPSYLAHELCALEAQVGKGAACTPTVTR